MSSKSMKILDVPQSGSIAGTTSSRNRFGQYRRTRAMPVNPNTINQALRRSQLTQLSQDFRDLTAAQRAGWNTLGGAMQRTDSLGQTISLTGLQAFVSVNAANLAAGNAIVQDAPALAVPDPLATLAVTTTGGTLSAAYTVTPLAAGSRLFMYASPMRSAGRSYESDYRLISVSAAAAASPANILAAYTARFGAPVIGSRIFFRGVVYNGGFQSAPIETSTVVVA